VVATPGDPDRRCRRLARPELIDRIAEACEQAGVTVRTLDSAAYPRALRGDRAAPAVLFTLGDPAILDGRPRVTVVGTRAATPYGVGVASELGEGLARARVAVISGLAPGIDSAAHAGALRADDGAVVAVLGAAIGDPMSGGRVALARAVAARGAILSEIPPGARSARWRFATRNRIMAALAHVVVVVESHHRGGALHTAAAALARGVSLTVVPGSVRSAASGGTNALLVDGATPVRDVDDVLTAVDLAIASDAGVSAPTRPTRRATASREPSSEPARRVYALLDHDPTPLDRLLRRGAMTVPELSLGLEQLTDQGLACEEAGCWRRTG
jgi:DNA processing protein